MARRTVLTRRPSRVHSEFPDKEAIRQRFQEHEDSNSSKVSDTHPSWQFTHDMELGDIVFAKRGSARLITFVLSTPLLS